METQLVLETERLSLTNWLPEQVDDLLAMHQHPEVVRFLTRSGAPWTLAQARERLAIWLDDFARHRMGKLRLIRKSDGVLVGRAGFGIYAPTKEPEIGYALIPQYWGNGYALEAALGLRDWIFRETAYDYFIGFADLRNPASLRILKTIGMRPTHVAKEPGGLTCQFHIFERQDLLAERDLHE